jgi:hypothetical protein
MTANAIMITGKQRPCTDESTIDKRQGTQEQALAQSQHIITCDLIPDVRNCGVRRRRDRFAAMHILADDINHDLTTGQRLFVNDDEGEDM